MNNYFMAIIILIISILMNKSSKLRKTHTLTKIKNHCEKFNVINNKNLNKSFNSVFTKHHIKSQKIIISLGEVTKINLKINQG